MHLSIYVGNGVEQFDIACKNVRVKARITRDGRSVTSLIISNNNKIELYKTWKEITKNVKNLASVSKIIGESESDVFEFVNISEISFDFSDFEESSESLKDEASIVIDGDWFIK